MFSQCSKLEIQINGILVSVMTIIIFICYVFSKNDLDGGNSKQIFKVFPQNALYFDKYNYI